MDPLSGKGTTSAIIDFVRPHQILMRYYLYTVSFGHGKMTGLQVVDDNIGQEFSLTGIAKSFKLQLKSIVVLFLKNITGSEASALYYECVQTGSTRNLTMPDSFSDVVGDCYLSGTDPRMNYSLL